MRISNAPQTSPSVCCRCFGPPNARKTNFGSLDLDFGGPTHHRAKRAAVGYSCTLQRRRTRNDRRTQHRSPLRKTGAGFGLATWRLGAQPDPSIYAGAGRLRHKSIAVDATPSPRLRPLVGVSFTPSTRADARCGTPPTMEKAPHLTQNRGGQRWHTPARYRCDAVPRTAPARWRAWLRHQHKQTLAAERLEESPRIIDAVDER